LGLRAPLKLADLLHAAALESSAATGAGKLLKALGGQSGGIVVDGSSVMRLVDGDRGVDNRGRDGLLVDDGLDVLVHVVVDAFARHRGAGRGRVRGVVSGAGVTVLGGVALEVLRGVGIAAMLEGLVLYRHHILGVLLRAGGGMLDRGTDMLEGTKARRVDLQNLLGCDGLYTGLVVLLVDVLVDGGGDILVFVRADVLLGSGTANVLVDGGFVLSVTGKEFSGGLLGALHCGCGRCLLKVCWWLLRGCEWSGRCCIWEW
jgi:hypothetical protein